MNDYEIFELGDVVLQEGATLRDARLAYKPTARSTRIRATPSSTRRGTRAFLIGFWKGFFLDDRDANNLLCMLWTWQNGDIGRTPGMGSDHEKALGAIEARAIVMPAEKDLYFPPEDEDYVVKRMPNAELCVIPGVWGTLPGSA